MMPEWLANIFAVVLGASLYANIGLYILLKDAWSPHHEG